MANLSNINNKFLVTTGGNVLIGQTSAVGTAKLQVTGEVRVYTGSNLGYLGVDSGNSYVYFGTNTSGYGLSLQTGGIDRININDAGNVFISTPITNAFYGLSLTYNSNNTADFTVNQATGQIKIGGVLAGYYPTFYAAGAERMRIDTSGNSTFTGNIMPNAENLYNIGSASVRWEDIWADQVYGRSVYVDNYIYHTGETTNNIGFTTGNFDVNVGGSNKVNIDANNTYLNNNNVLVNNNGGSLVIDGTGASELRMAGPNGYYSFMMSTQVRRANAITWSNLGTDGSPVNDTVTADLMTLSYTGYLGIGTTLPASELHVESANPIITLQRNNNGNASGAVQFRGSDNAVDWQIGTNQVVGLGLEFNFQNSNKVYIETGGNVGIGTTSPDYNLEVEGTDAKTFVHYVSSSRGGIAAFSSQRVAFTTTSASDDLVFGYNSATSATSANFVEHMRIDNGTGRVGIGIDPVYKLDVRGERFRLNPNTSGLVLTEMQNGTGSFYFGIDNTTGSSFGGENSARTIYSQGAYSMAFWTNNAERMCITSGGGVIINGTSSYHVTEPSHFAVVGNGTTYTSPASNNVSQITVENRNTSDAPGHTILLLRPNVDGTASTGPNAGNAFISFDSYNYAGWTAGVDFSDGRNFKITTSWADVSGTGVELTYNGTAWQANSDERLKENIVNINTVLDKIDNIRCVKYNFISEEEMPTQYGFIAQDWQENFSEVLSVSKDPKSSIENKLSMKYTETIPILMKAIQELKAEIDELKK